MPKFETKEKFLFNLLGREYTDDELEQVFPRAKAELDEHDKENGVSRSSSTTPTDRTSGLPWVLPDF